MSRATDSNFFLESLGDDRADFSALPNALLTVTMNQPTILKLVFVPLKRGEDKKRASISIGGNLAV
jgi:hypothetical protein